MPAIAAEVPDVARCMGEAIKHGIPLDIVDNKRVILYGSDVKISQVVAASDGVITRRKNMVRRRGN